MTLTPEDFATGWGTDDLVRMVDPEAMGVFPGDARRFLVGAGLPALIRYSEGSEGADVARITFGRLARGPTPILDEQISGGPLPAGWSSYRIVGDEFFSNGSAWWCLDEQTGSVERIDIELDEPIEFANSSVAQFASCVLAVVQAASCWSRGANDWPSRVASLGRDLAEIDPAAMASGRNFWPRALDFSDDGDPPRYFLKGTYSEGMRSFSAGPW